MPGPRLIVTRPEAQAVAWVQALQRLGVDAQALPLIAIAPPLDPQPVRAAWRVLPAADLVMFVSANAVEQFFALRPPDSVWPARTLAGSTGPGTSAALREAAVPPDALAQPAEGERAESESLWNVLRERAWRGRRVLIVRGEDGRDWLADRLREAGAEVAFVAAYRRHVPEPDAKGAALLQAAVGQPSAHAWLFSSSEAVGYLATLFASLGHAQPDQASLGPDWSSATALATHPRIAQAAQAAGFGRVALVEPTPEGVASTWVTLQSAAS
jgi:uroporphyrinogen-III synthase